MTTRLTARTRPRGGFTMIELLVVMAIMTVLGVFAALMIPNMQDKAKAARTKALMKQFEIALGEYRSDFGDFPAGDIDLVINMVTTTSGGWARGSTDWFDGRTEYVDGWGEPLAYCCHTQYDTPEAGYTVGRGVERTPESGIYYNPDSYQLYSKGPNMRTWPKKTEGTKKGYPRLPGTEPDDIRNWEHEKYLTPTDYGL